MLDQNAPLVRQLLDALSLGSVLEPVSDEPLCGIYRVRRAQDPEAEEMLEEQWARTMIGQAFPVPREVLRGFCLPRNPLVVVVEVVVVLESDCQL